MQKVATAVVLAIAMAIAAPSLSAQTSGWILWEKNMIDKPGGPMAVTWEPLDGYQALAECRAAGQEHLKNALAYMKSGAGKLLGPVRPDGRSATFEVTTDATRGTIDIRYLCFPGGFDPRPHTAPVPAKP